VPDVFKTFGEPTNTSAELKVLKWYFVFQILQVFLVNTIASGAAAVISQVASTPSSIPTLLADNLPSASNSYLTYFIVQGLTSGSNNLLNQSDLASFLFFDYFLNKTPREKYNSFTSLKGIAWGKVFPKYGNFLIIGKRAQEHVLSLGVLTLSGIVYSCIAPLVLGFAAAGLTLLYISYRYMLLFTVQPKIDTKGHCYTLALQQILIGVYIAEVCLIGLFGLRSATGPSILLIILLAITILFNVMTNRYLSPLEQFLPADLASESGDLDEEEASLLTSAEEGEGESHIQRLASHAHIPPKYTFRLARFFEPHIFASHRAMKAWLRSDNEYNEDEVPHYNEEQMRKAYLDPAYTSEMPVVWLPRDEWGVSKKEVAKNEGDGLKCSDEGAWIDGNGQVKWSVEDFRKLPVFKEGTIW
jgi:hypothetical protein